MKKLLLLITIIVESMSLSMWFYCRDFTDFLDMSSINLTLHLDSLIDSDKGMSPFVVRIFHNKIEDFTTAVLKRYLLFWDVRFDVPFFSIIGYFGMICGFYYFVTQKRKHWYYWLAIVILLCIPFIQIFLEPHINFVVKIILFSASYFLFSLYGIWKFLQASSKRRIAFIVILLLLSLWWIVGMRSEIIHYCVK